MILLCILKLILIVFCIKVSIDIIKVWGDL